MRPRFFLFIIIGSVALIALGIVLTFHFLGSNNAVKEVTKPPSLRPTTLPPPAGQIAFTKDPPLGQGRQDMWAMNADGSEQRRLITNASSFNFGWSPDTSTSVAEIDKKICIAGLDGSEPKPVITSQRSYNPSWSPDGKYIVYGQGLEGRVQGVYISEVDGRNTRKVYETSISAWGFSWSPVGNKIAFREYSGNSGAWIVHVIDLDNNADKVISTKSLGEFSWSPDGRSVLVRETGGLTIISTTGEIIYKFPWDGIQAKFSPDGKQIAFSYVNEVYVANADGSEVHPITHDLSTVDIYVSWSPDSSYVAYAGSTKIYVGKNSGETSRLLDIYIAAADGSGQWKLTDDMGNHYPIWSPTNKRYITASSNTTMPSPYERQLQIQAAALKDRTSRPVLFQDDFTDKLGWSTPKTEREGYFFESAYELGALKLTHRNKQQLNISSSTDLRRLISQDNFEVEFDAVQVSAGKDGYYGIIFRKNMLLVMMQPQAAQYTFWLNPSDGSYLFDARGKTITKIASGNALQYLNKDDKNNHVKIVADGQHIEAYVNNHLVVSIDESTFKRGGFALGVQGADTVVKFDNFVLRTIP